MSFLHEIFPPEHLAGENHFILEISYQVEEGGWGEEERTWFHEPEALIRQEGEAAPSFLTPLETQCHLR